MAVAPRNIGHRSWRNSPSFARWVTRNIFILRLGLSCRIAGEQGIEWITCGSAADSLVCYCLDISGVCPIRFRSLFPSLPQQGPDGAQQHCRMILTLILRTTAKTTCGEAFIFEKYKKEHCAVVGGFSTFQARSAFAKFVKSAGRCGKGSPANSRGTVSVEFGSSCGKPERAL